MYMYDKCCQGDPGGMESDGAAVSWGHLRAHVCVDVVHEEQGHRVAQQEGAGARRGDRSVSPSPGVRARLVLNHVVRLHVVSR